MRLEGPSLSLARSAQAAGGRKGIELLERYLEGGAKQKASD